jgi:hypothetical protein
MLGETVAKSYPFPDVGAGKGSAAPGAVPGAPASGHQFKGGEVLTPLRLRQAPLAVPSTPLQVVRVRAKAASRLRQG